MAELAEVVRRVKSTAVPEPEPRFWQNFNQELHLKLAQSVPAPPPSRVFKLPYLLGAPALALLLIWVAVGYLNPERSVLAPTPQMAKQERAIQERAAEKMVAKPRVTAPSPETTGVVAFVAQNGEEMSPDDDLTGLRGDLDSTLAGMTEQEKEAFLKRLRQHEKDGSCLRKISVIFWA
ncbi:MAG: hypothetical protein PHU44_06260 [Syntrophales bacterium]|nr:hypothetical protein [Syntrophales bacterium]